MGVGPDQSSRERDRQTTDKFTRTFTTENVTPPQSINRRKQLILVPRDVKTRGKLYTVNIYWLSPIPVTGSLTGIEMTQLFLTQTTRSQYKGTLNRFSAKKRLISSHIY